MAKQERNIISEKLVFAKTNKTIEEWFKYLDKQGAKKLSHVEIYTLVNSTPGLKALGDWNHNLLSTTYEWSRGLKERGQKGKEFEISVSKTVLVSVNILYSSVADDKIRNKWLKEKITIRKSTENKSARITWTDNETRLSVDFYSKDENKSQIVVQHLKIKDSKQAAQLKEFWGVKLEVLKKFLEK